MRLGVPSPSRVVDRAAGGLPLLELCHLCQRLFLSLLGIHKDTTTSDERAKAICEQLRKQSFQPGWAYEHEVPGKINATYQPVYDDDGRYFRCIDRPHNLVLIVQRPGWPKTQSSRARGTAESGRERQEQVSGIQVQFRYGREGTR